MERHVENVWIVHQWTVVCIFLCPIMGGPKPQCKGLYIVSTRYLFTPTCGHTPGIRGHCISTKPASCTPKANFMLNDLHRCHNR